jgi:two-component system, NtrC family, response regulator PilR
MNRQFRILAVDDEPNILSAYAAFFPTYGFQVTTAETLAAAQVVLGEAEFDVLLLDLRLSGFDDTDGLRVARLAKELGYRSKIIMLTAYGTPEIEAAANAVGVDKFLSKPQGLANLAKLMQGMLA